MVVGGENDLRVRRCPKAVPVRLQLPPQLEVVVDLTVVEQPVAIVFISHRLPTVGGEVEDRETAVGEHDAGFLPPAFIVGTAVRQARRHAAHLVGDGARKVNDAGEPAHALKLSPHASCA